MADKRISELTATSSLTGKEVLPIVQSGATKKVTVDTLLANVKADDALSTTSTNPVQNKVISEALESIQNKLTAGNGISITKSGSKEIIAATPLINDSSISADKTYSSSKIESKIDLKQDKMSAGNGIDFSTSGGIVVVSSTPLINDTVVSTGVNNKTYSSLKIASLLDEKQDNLIAGTGIKIDSTNTISSTVINDSATSGDKITYSIDKIKSTIGSPLRFKGRVQNLTELNAITGASSGDVYVVTDENKTYALATDNTWYQLGSGNMDMSDYYNKVAVDNLLNTKQDSLIASTGIIINNDDTIKADVIRDNSDTSTVYTWSIDKIKTVVGTPMRYRGEITTMAGLNAIIGAEEGDVYKVKETLNAYIYTSTDTWEKVAETSAVNDALESSSEKTWSINRLKTEFSQDGIVINMPSILTKVEEEYTDADSIAILRGITSASNISLKMTGSTGVYLIPASYVDFDGSGVTQITFYIDCLNKNNEWFGTATEFDKFKKEDAFIYELLRDGTKYYGFVRLVDRNKRLVAGNGIKITTTADTQNVSGYSDIITADVIDDSLTTSDKKTYSIDKIRDIVGHPFRFKGEVATVASLSSITNPEVGDVYLTQDTKETYAYTEEAGVGKWVNIGDTDVDFSDYYTKTETKTFVENYFDTTLSTAADKVSTSKAVRDYLDANHYTKTETDDLLDKKEDTLTAGNYIKIEDVQETDYTDPDNPVTVTKHTIGVDLTVGAGLKVENKIVKSDIVKTVTVLPSDSDANNQFIYALKGIDDTSLYIHTEDGWKTIITELPDDKKYYVVEALPTSDIDTDALYILKKFTGSDMTGDKTTTGYTTNIYDGTAWFSIGGTDTTYSAGDNVTIDADNKINVDLSEYLKIEDYKIVEVGDTLPTTGSVQHLYVTKTHKEIDSVMTTVYSYYIWVVDTDDDTQSAWRMIGSSDTVFDSSQYYDKNYILSVFLKQTDAADTYETIADHATDVAAAQALIAKKQDSFSLGTGLEWDIVETDIDGEKVKTTYLKANMDNSPYKIVSSLDSVTDPSDAYIYMVYVEPTYEDDGVTVKTEGYFAQWRWDTDTSEWVSVGSATSSIDLDNYVTQAQRTEDLALLKILTNAILG